MSKRWEKLLGTIVVSAFSFAAISLIGLLINLFYLHASASHWIATPATVSKGELIQNELPGKSMREKIIVKYQYHYKNLTYTGSQLDFSLGSDNFSSDRRHKQMQALQNEHISVWVNPRAPTQSVVDRSLPVSQVSFVIFFLIFPCGLGTLFLWVYLLKGFSKITSIQTERYAMPLWFFFHGSPAAYTLLFSFSEVSFGSFLILSFFSILMLYGGVEVVRRRLNPMRGATQIRSFVH